MKRKATGMMLLILVLLLGGLTGCGEQKKEESEYNVYYIDKDKTGTIAVGYEPKASNADGMIEEMIKILSRSTNSPDYQKSIPEDVYVDSWKLENAQLYLYFNSDYSEMDNIVEVLCRASIVKTMTQIDGIECISFYVGDTPLVDANGVPVGLMTADSFIENTGEQINAIQSSEITVYFSNNEGTKLIPEVQEVHYSSNVSVEKLIIEHLLKGPKGKGLRSAVPKETKLVNVSVLDGVCFVNLDEGFMNHNYEIAEPIVIYSIVNSLVELSNVNKVQIAVNGDSNKIYRDSYDLSVMYERNLDFMDTGVQNEEGEGEVD